MDGAKPEGSDPHPSRAPGTQHGDASLGFTSYRDTLTITLPM